MQAKYPIELTRQELRAIIEAFQLLINRDYQLYGRAAIRGAEDESDSLLDIKQRIDNRRDLHTRLSDIEFDLWRKELREDHIRADAEEAARYDSIEREIDD